MSWFLQPGLKWSSGFPRGAIGKELTCQCRRCQLDLWVRKIPLQEGMAAHSSILAWRTPWTEELGGLQSTGLQRVIRHNSSDLAHTHSRVVFSRVKNADIFHLLGFNSIKDLKALLHVALEAEPGPCPKDAMLFLSPFFLVFASLSFLNQQLFKYAFWNSRKVREAGICSLQGTGWGAWGGGGGWNGNDGKPSVSTMSRSPTGSCVVSCTIQAIFMPKPYCACLLK